MLEDRHNGLRFFHPKMKRIFRLMLTALLLGPLSMLRSAEPSHALLAGMAGTVNAAEPVHVYDEKDRIIMENGLIRLTYNVRSGNFDSVQAFREGKFVEVGGAFYLDANGGRSTQPKTSQYVGALKGGQCSIIHRGPDIAEIIVRNGWENFPFRTEAHFRLARGESGFHAYVVFCHGSGDPGGTIEQARFVMKGVEWSDLFTHGVVDDRRQGIFPSADVVEEVQDATLRLADGTIYTKYDSTAFTADDLVHGMAGHGLGIWIISPSREYINGAPLHQNLTVHLEHRNVTGPKQRVLLSMFQSCHFGAAPICVADNETWSRFYGPVFVYINQGGSIDALWADAKRRSQSEEEKWPYPWVDSSSYPIKRGRLTGKVRLADGSNPANAWVILVSSADKDWAISSKGYTFWTKADAEGGFVISNVRPGQYTLFISGANQFEDFRREHVPVQANQTTELGALVWRPVTHGRQLWQIGRADRSTAEFKGGDDCRHYDNFIRYAADFPNDVNFVIGKSKEREDWNFAQWGWYCKNPAWTIQFDLARALAGKATLTLGIAAANPPEHSRLRVKVNGRLVGDVALRKSGAAGYRSGGQDSDYQLVYLPFDAQFLCVGLNRITLEHTKAIPFADPDNARPGRIGYVMYDALRLEVE